MAAKRAKTVRARGDVADDPRVRELYAADPREFTRARDALARELAAQGDARAERVKHLRRPTVAVSLLNGVARERPGAIEALFEAGDRLRDAQQRALRGDAGELREAGAAMHDAVATLVEAARARAAAHHHAATAPLLGEVERALRTVAVGGGDERAALRGAVLDRLPLANSADLFGGVGDVRLPPADRRAAGRSRRTPRARAPDGVAAARREARAHAAASRREADRAKADADRERRRLGAAEERLQRAQRTLEDARRRAEAARGEVTSAQAAVRSAEQRAEQASTRASAADRDPSGQ